VRDLRAAYRLEFAPMAAKPRLFPITLNVSHAAAACGVSRRVLYEANRAGHLAIYRYGPARRIVVSDLVEWIKKHWTKD
jgi:excisionase family DNA binding protein